MFYAFLTGLSVYFSAVALMTAAILNAAYLRMLVLAVGQFGAVIVGVLVVSSLPLWFLWRFRRMIRTTARSVISGFACAAGSLTPLIVLSLENQDHDDWRTIYWTIGVLPLLFCVVTTTLTWIFRSLSEPVIIQDRTRCPQCGYRLIGNESMRCPECGRVYTYLELGTTEQRFREAQQAFDSST